MEIRSSVKVLLPTMPVSILQSLNYSHRRQTVCKSSPGAPDTPPVCRVLGGLAFLQLNMCCALVSGGGLGLHCEVLACGHALAAMVCVCTGVVSACSMLALLLLPRALLIMRRVVTVSMPTSRLSQRRQNIVCKSSPRAPDTPLVPCGMFTVRSFCPFTPRYVLWWWWWWWCWSVVVVLVRAHCQSIHSCFCGGRWCYC